MKFEFVCAEHKEYGHNGWRLKSQPNFDPLAGMAVAHDCLEHFSDDGSVAAEYMALGASMFIRDEYFYNHKGKIETNPGVHIASDMPDIMRHILQESYEFPKAPRTYPLESEVEGWINRMFQEYHRNIREEYDYKDLKLSVDIKRSIRSYLRIGYRKAKKRYGRDHWGAQTLFREIEEKADKALKSAEEGTELHVIVDFRTLTCKIKTTWELEDY